MTDPKADGAAPPPPPPPTPAALVEAVARFERGDFLGARLEIERQLSLHPPPEVEAAARALLARLASDPWAARFGVLVLVLLALVTGLYVR
jgi:hypothetical protein